MRPTRAALEEYVVRLTVEVVRLEAQGARLSIALVEIAGTDYLGNRSQESEIAYRALVAAGMRPA